MRYFPLFIDLKDAPVLVVGGGAQATAKLRSLLKTEAQITVISPSIETQIAAWQRRGRLTWLRRAFEPGDVTGQRLIVVATGDPDADRVIAALARDGGTLVNVADNRDASNAITPAIVDRSPLVVAIGSEGSAPALVRAIKARIEALLPLDLGDLARMVAPARAATVGVHGRRLRDAIARFFDGEGERALAGHGTAGARRVLDDLIAEASRAPAPRGEVALVGAGPGDPELLTLKARRSLDQADVVLYDRLVDPRIIDLARREATLIEVGKTAEGESWAQAEINALMVRHAAAGARVVRLKSGDPLLFGRADEEIAALEAADLPYKIIPGVSAAFAAAASAGFSLTRRGRNRSVVFLTAHDIEGFADHDWRALARKGSAIAVYMGVKAARFVQGRLMIHGADPTMPITIVERASRQDEKKVYGTLGDLGALLEDSGIKGPAVIFIGLAPSAAKQTNANHAGERALAFAGGARW